MRRPKRAMRGTFLFVFIYVCGSVLECQVRANEPADNIIEAFDVACDGDFLLVPVVIGNQKLQFAVDTGASLSMVDPLLKAELHPRSGFARMNGNVREKLFILRAAFAGKSRHPLEGNAICLDLSRFRRASGRDIRGVLGIDILNGHVIQVDFDAGKLSILRAAPASAGSEFRLTFNRFEQPSLHLEMEDGDTVAWVVDTGNIGSALTMTSYRFDELVENRRAERIGSTVPTEVLEGPIRSRTGRLDKFRLGGFTHEGVSMDEGVQNQIGMALLSRYTVTFDFPNQRLYLKPGKRFMEPEHFGRSGLAIERVGGKTRIKEVRNDGPAVNAGLTVGDEILAVDGKDASSFSVFEIKSILSREGRRVRLGVEGPAGRRQVDIRISGPHEEEGESPQK